MTCKANSKLIPLGRANRKTRASSPSGRVESIPANKYLAD